jgi:putative ABC transport system permease protein
MALLALATVFAAAAEPRVRNRIEDAALRDMVRSAPIAARDVSFAYNRLSSLQPPDVGTLRTRAVAGLPEELARITEASWAWTRTGGQPLDGPAISYQPGGFAPRVTIEFHTGVAEAVTMRRGAPPASRDGVVDVMVSEAVADTLALRVGGQYLFLDQQPVRVAGVFIPRDAAAPIWLSEPTALATGLLPDISSPLAENPRLRRTGTVFTDTTGLRLLEEHQQTWGMSSTVRVRLADDRIDAGQIGGLQVALQDLRVSPRLIGFRVDTGLDRLLTDFLRQAAAMRAVLAVVTAGALGAALGLGVLTARLAVDRRRAELALVRARGAAVRRVAGSLATEAMLMVAPAAVAGWAAAVLVPGRAPGGTSWLPVGSAVVVAAAVPLAGALTRPGTQERRDVAVVRPSLARRTVEVTALVLAALGVLLLHRRGLSTQGIDPYLSAVPVLIGVAVGLLALRVYPWPVRLLGRLAVRRRGAVPFLGLARAGRVGPAAALPLVVLVLAVATGSFAGAVRDGVAAARDTVAAREVGAHFRLAAGGASFGPGTLDAVAAVRGVTGVAAVYRAQPGSALFRVRGTEPDAVVVALDVPAYSRILGEIGLGLDLPADIAAGIVPGGDQLPAYASTALAGRLDDTVTVRIPGTDAETDRRIRLVGTGEELPGLRRGAGDFLAVPWQPGMPVNEVLVSGATADPARLQAAVASPGGLVTVTSLAEQRRALERHAFNEGITVAFTIGTAAGLLAALLAVTLALVVDAPARGRAVSLLRTMGLSVRQARALLLIELLPLVGVAVLTGALVGMALPTLLAPALGLDAFTAGVPMEFDLDPTIAALLAGLCGGLVLVGVVTEAAANRRLGLGTVLRA